MKQRAFLKWAGGKFRLTDEISRYLPKKACLVEPFVGAGSVFLNTDFERYILADVNPDLINLFNTVKQDVDAYIQHSLALFLAPNANTREFYNAQRERFNHSSDPFTRSVIFLYLNRFGFNGLCRYNKKQQYNVPFGRYKKHYFPEKELRFFAEKAQKATFICADFQQTFDLLLENSDDYVVYCDPPYAPIQQETNFTHYAGGGFSLEQQQALAERAKQANMPVLISNHDTPFTRQIYAGAKLHSLKVQRSIGKSAETRVKIDELLALFK
ncbi:Dam [Bibersteinia trehalosi USDA-ARS-USMARC-188]|uniref:Site-specific DNA-methyltransferase (adenine-specific) n=2 Tax=Bibersteinia trehalosi TaxID=47735 RepID=A0A4V7I817_BIBTR|nr:Dam family site-specific DNA-(adenine-N6)-methyltransferase [Bibersteinia trehalosi]AGH39080.1 Dam [Bibersteinia trehalosi USDA-ARS-USMARC-192]AHG81173.1 Dam [Bibersteinia trehalosi USDA-ARS-USMARC-188]AHG83385.1 Dam [Bibersteinia trehalosi USDA-ARS-USMARC-189]